MSEGYLGPWLLVFLRMSLSQGLLLEFEVLAQAGPIGPVVGPCSPAEQRWPVAGWTQIKG